MEHVHKPHPSFPATRRKFLVLGAGGALAAAAAATAGPASAEDSAPGAGNMRRRLDTALAGLEAVHGVTIGVTAGRPGQPPAYAYRSEDTFPMCSLFKTLAVARLLRDHAYDDDFWQRRISFRKDQIVQDSVICAADKDRNMSVDELSDAALRYSDNTAGNLLLGLIGGPPEIGAYARTLGALSTGLDRWEPELNQALPGDLRDTSTPSDIQAMYGALLLGDALDTLGQARLRGWMLRNATTGKRLGSVVPPGAELADKTGAGGYGVVNDAGVVWPDSGPPLALAVMTRTDRADAVNSNAVVARVGQLIFGELL